MCVCVCVDQTDGQNIEQPRGEGGSPEEKGAAQRRRGQPRGEGGSPEEKGAAQRRRGQPRGEGGSPEEKGAAQRGRVRGRTNTVLTSSKDNTMTYINIGLKLFRSWLNSSGTKKVKLRYISMVTQTYITNKSFVG